MPLFHCSLLAIHSLSLERDSRTPLHLSVSLSLETDASLLSARAILSLYSLASSLAREGKSEAADVAAG
jgi:hypothetical protein